MKSQIATSNGKNRIILIDNFVDDRVLSMLTKRAEGVTATIHTRYSEQFLIDDKVHFLGASIKDMGAGLCAVTAMEVAPETILELVK